MKIVTIKGTIKSNNNSCNRNDFINVPFTFVITYYSSEPSILELYCPPHRGKSTHD